MQETNSNDGSAGLILSGTVLLLVVLGGAAFFWHRQQLARAQAVQAHQMALEAAAQLAMKTEVMDREAEKQTAVDTRTFEAIITRLLRAQQEAWNRGDLDAFMEPYWKSDRLTFASSGKVIRGWAATLDRYKTKYPTSNEMGRLSFDNLEFMSIGRQAVLVLGEWKLNRKAGDIGGNFSLVWQFIDEQWVIIHDHSSASE